jgi:hypothetical protein
MLGLIILFSIHASIYAQEIQSQYTNEYANQIFNLVSNNESATQAFILIGIVSCIVQAVTIYRFLSVAHTGFLYISR